MNLPIISRQVRGAPAIAIVASLALAVEAATLGSEWAAAKASDVVSVQSDSAGH